MQRQGANKAVIMSECVEHTQKGRDMGYGSSSVNGVQVSLHRLAYWESKGISLEAIRGLLVSHTCDNPRCINPEHLLIGTHQDNSNDMTSRGRQAKGEKQGSAKLTEEYVKFIREKYVRYSSQWGTVALARMLGVSQATVQYVTSGETWKHMEDSPCTQVSG